MTGRTARCFALLAALLLGGAARADDAARVSSIRDRVLLAGDVLRVAHLAGTCNLRDADWVTRLRDLVAARQAVDVRRHADEVEGGEASLRWMMLGTRLYATAAATAEHERYGQAACRELKNSGDLTSADRLLASR
ncbi:hypothetical protein ACE7GA_27020 (plasmid) [Roseomonas sp. CCTCC AB2023176]|uniref:hypothetical protein n=1 Tax=Roseomonas sp. CCTCC AB2023176 TaxID=3342640 RepID=UPI0035DCDF13